jgi:Flp pilus assembly pilin Flp
MSTLIQRFHKLYNDEAGQGLIEYVMLGAVVIAATAACFPNLSGALSNAFQAVGSKLGAYLT